MADETYVPKIHKTVGVDGGDEIIIEDGARIKPGTGVTPTIAKITNIASGTEIATAVNAIIDALAGVGISLVA